MFSYDIYREKYTMKKLKITKKQYNTILLHEQKSRLSTSNSVIGENLDSSTQLLEEGWKEVVLGVAMMLGVGLTGQNKAIAQNAVKNAETMSQIKSTLEDETKLKELVDAFKEKGMKDPTAKLSKNAEMVMTKYNKIASDEKLPYKVSTKVVDNLQDLAGKLDRGYALTKADMTTDTIKGAETKTIVSIKDTVDIKFGSDNFFVTGGYTLSENGNKIINDAIDAIKNKGGKIIGVEIESSTDAEEIVKFKSESDPTGNIKLAELRTKSVADKINTLVSDVSISHREIPNNDSQEVSTQDFLRVAKDPIKTKELRDKTHEYRYVKVKITAVFDSEKTVIKTGIENIIKDYRFELVRVIDNSTKDTDIPTKPNFPNKKFKCKKGGTDCYTF